jgi:MFS family permease
MFDLSLFRIRAYTAGVVAAFLSAMGRGGLQFMLIIWLQGIWLPQHGYDFARTPLWAGIALVPLTLGVLISGPTSGILADRLGARGIATIALFGTAVCYFLLESLPINFDYIHFALILFFFSFFAGMFFTPNQTAVMNSLPPSQRGAGAGMNASFVNSAQVLSIGVFFSIVTLGLVSSLPGHLAHGLIAEGVPAGQAEKVANLPPIGSLFAAFLGYNPIQTLLPHHVLAALGSAKASYLTGRTFFPHLISSSFQRGLGLAFDFAAGTAVVAGVVSWTRGARFIHAEHDLVDDIAFGLHEVGEMAAGEVGVGISSSDDTID